MGVILGNMVVALVLLGGFLRLVDVVFDMETYSKLGAPDGSLWVGTAIVVAMAVGAVYVQESTVATTRTTARKKNV